MAVIELHRDRLQQNYDFLRDLLEEHGIDWGVVAKMLCGNKLFLEELLRLGAREIHDSRLSNLRAIKSVNPDVQTVYIKPPAKRSIAGVVKYADVSFNSEIETIRELSAQAVQQDRWHKVIIMIELGDLREGVMGDEVVDFYGEIFELPNISIVGLGANLNCLSGVMPSQDKLTQLVLYEKLIEAKFNREIPWVSGGSTVTLPLLMRGQLPVGVNHFRLGEALFFGANLFDHTTFEGMRNDVFELEAEIVELHVKPRAPSGEMGRNVAGESIQVDASDYGRTHHRAIIDVGLLETGPEYLLPYDSDIEFIGGSSDMIVLDLGDNIHGYAAGDTIRFKLKYMGALGLMNSRYIGKKVVGADGDVSAVPPAPPEKSAKD